MERSQTDFFMLILHDFYSASFVVIFGRLFCVISSIFQETSSHNHWHPYGLLNRSCVTTLKQLSVIYSRKETGNVYTLTGCHSVFSLALQEKLHPRGSPHRPLKLHKARRNRTRDIIWIPMFSSEEAATFCNSINYVD